MRKFVSAAVVVAAMVVGFAHPAAVPTWATATGTIGLNRCSSTSTRTVGDTTCNGVVGTVPSSGNLTR
jgi:hypothetical protein